MKTKKSTFFYIFSLLFYYCLYIIYSNKMRKDRTDLATDYLFSACAYINIMYAYLYYTHTSKLSQEKFSHLIKYFKLISIY